MTVLLPHEAPDIPSWVRLQDAAPVGVDEMARHYRRAFTSDSGIEVQEHLRRKYLEHEVEPGQSDAALWHAEGARSVVRYILKQIEQGQK
jgi:hypothetical protein